MLPLAETAADQTPARQILARQSPVRPDLARLAVVFPEEVVPEMPEAAPQKYSNRSRRWLRRRLKVQQGRTSNASFICSVDPSDRKSIGRQELSMGFGEFLMKVKPARLVKVLDVKREILRFLRNSPIALQHRNSHCDREACITL